jgi:hypothetical protein
MSLSEENAEIVLGWLDTVQNFLYKLDMKSNNYA